MSLAQSGRNIKDQDEDFAGDVDGDSPTVALKVDEQSYTLHDSDDLVASKRLGSYQKAWDIKSNHEGVGVR